MFKAGTFAVALTAAGAIAASQSLAADMPVKAPPAPIYSGWTGFYAGLNAGYGWSPGESSLEYLFNGAPMAITAGVPASYQNHSSGFIGGGQFGYNYQIGRTVLGLEADLSYSDINNDNAINGTTGGGTPFTSTQTENLKWLATVRGRLGYTPYDSLLLYVTGGSAFGRVEDTNLLAFHTVGGTTYFGTRTSTRSGWTAGGGAEYKIGARLTAKAEYLHFDLGSTTVYGIDVTSPGNPFQTHAQFEHAGHIVRLGLNYQFGQ
jgi:outer membrane immunogenic protein